MLVQIIEQNIEVEAAIFSFDVPRGDESLVPYSVLEAAVNGIMDGIGE